MRKRAFYRTIVGVCAMAFVLACAAVIPWLAESFSAGKAAAPSGEALAGIVMDGVPETKAATQKDETPLPTASAPAVREMVMTPEPLRFVIGVRDGYIAVYSDTGTDVLLKEMTNIPVHALPDEEQERLHGGIVVEGVEALARILEDYGS